MSGCIEHDKCDFCKQEKPVWRTYLRPTKYVKPENLEEANKLYNQGSYFIIVKTCNDCGEPTFNQHTEDKETTDPVCPICKSYEYGYWLSKDKMYCSDCGYNE